MKRTNQRSMDRFIYNVKGVPSDNNSVLRHYKKWKQKLGIYSVFTAASAIGALQSDVRSHVSSETNGIEPTSVGLNRRYLSGTRNRKIDLLGSTAGADNCPGTAIPSGSYTVAAPYTAEGTTSGGNNTVGTVGWAYWDAVEVPGSDQIYSFTLTGRGSSPYIRVQSTSGGYRPSVYVLDQCPSGISNWVERNYGVLTAPPTSQSEILFGMHHFPVNRRLYLFIDSGVGGGSGSYSLKMQDITIARSQRNNFDFDGNGRADHAVWRSSEGRWYIYNSNGIQSIDWGLNGDRPVPADYDGDGITDLGVFRPSNGRWYRIGSSLNLLPQIQWGLSGDVPAAADYNGDGQADLAVWRPSDGRWYIYTGMAMYSVAWGQVGDIPLPGYYVDDDGTADLAVFRNGEWFILDPNTGAMKTVNWGLQGDIPVPADYDADGKTDVAVWRQSNGRWYFQFSSSGNWIEIEWGLPGDIPVPGDYDGDGKFDVAVWRPSEGKWYIAPWASNATSASWGLAGDYPVPRPIGAD